MKQRFGSTASSVESRGRTAGKRGDIAIGEEANAMVASIGDQKSAKARGGEANTRRVVEERFVSSTIPIAR